MYDKSKLNLVSELKPPYRSPLAVVDAISDYIKDKVVCELGSAKCDLFPKFLEYTNKVKGFEWKKEYVDFSVSKGYDVICGDWTTDDLPDADVYYFWCGYKEQNQFLIERLINEKPNSIIIAAGDSSFKENTEVMVMNELNTQYGGSIITVPFNEGN